MTVYAYFNNPFSVYCCSPSLNPPHIIIVDSPLPNKRARSTSDPPPADISVIHGKYGSTLTTPSNYPQRLEPDYDDPDNIHTIISDNHCGSMMKKILQKLRFYCSICSINKRVYYCRGPVIMSSQLKSWFI